MDKKNNSRQKKIFFFFLILSFLFHLLFLAVIPQEGELTPLVQEPLDLTILKQKRIADIEKPPVQQRPDKADFVGQYDSRVKKEMVAPSRPLPTPDAAPSEKMKPSERYALKAKRQKSQTIKRAQETQRKAVAPREDFYPDYRVGPHTYLNVLRFPDVKYFVRLKRTFKLTFNPVPALRASYGMNQISKGSVNVVLGVEISPNGQLSKLFVINSSGLPRYDQEAMRTVQDSAPFSSPPKKIRDKDGVLRMSWTFTVYL